MGVLGITPFLQKTCPGVFDRLADRLRSLAGRTVVLDGTLVTQRLHFAPMPHPHRHILGWHRILTELRHSGVRAICVFDGKERIAAKAREVQRRRESRKIVALRGSIERTRLHRLQRLIRLLPYYRSLPSTDRQRVNDVLSGINSARTSIHARVSGSAIPASTTPPPHTSSPQIDPVASQSQHPYFCPHRGSGIRELQNVLDPQPAFPCSSRSEPHYMLPSVLSDVLPCTVTDDEFGSCDPCGDILQTLPFVHWNTAVQPSYLSPDGIDSFQAELSALYFEYAHSITQLTSMPSPFDGPEIPESVPADGSVTVDARVEYAMSKQQLQMTLDEGRIWDSLSAPSSDVLPFETESALQTLAERSTLVSQSYQRRANSPTAQTFEECKELLRAMGVPCIESSGPFEAEALACALVSHGHADYVVSEDTDVLVYEAPMLRGITARESPIVVVHGESIRSTLQLDRASYIDFALLLGTDFSQRIKNVGPNRALKFIREHGSIERVIEQESKYPPRLPIGDYLAQVAVARLVFQNLPPLPDIELLHQGQEDPNAVTEIVQRYGLHRLLSWDTQSALAGNYFGDDPSVW